MRPRDFIFIRYRSSKRRLDEDDPVRVVRIRIPTDEIVHPGRIQAASLRTTSTTSAAELTDGSVI
jgi:hypothetical protein